MLQQWDKRGKNGDDCSKAQRGQELATYPKQGQSWIRIPSPPPPRLPYHRARGLLLAKQERPTRMKAQPKKGHFYMRPYSFFQESQASLQEQNYYNIYSQPKQVTPTLIDRNEAFVLQKGQPLNGLPFSFSSIWRVV